MADERKNLGDILLEQGVIDTDALNHALRLQGRRLGEILIEERLADPIHIAAALKTQARSPLNRGGARLTMDMATLETLLRQLEDVEDSIIKSGAPAVTRAALISVRHNVEDALIGPMDKLLQRTKWIASRTARDLGKDVNFVIEGGGIVVDRTIVDELSDVTLHLVRNAIDHGIEKAAVRVAKGKTDTGNLAISVATAKGQLVLSVSDDGAGIDLDRVYNKAHERGLVAASRDKVSREELYRLLFTPGFSTADEVSSLSGRGIGLDVVEASTTRMGGKVRVWSEKDKGTTFTVLIPLRYVRVHVIPMRAGSNWVALKQSDIARVRLPTDVVESPMPRWAAELFSDFVAPATASARVPSSSSLIVETVSGARWIFDEMGQTEQTILRMDVATTVPAGVIGTVRLTSGKSLLVFDLESFG